MDSFVLRVPDVVQSGEPQKPIEPPRGLSLDDDSVVLVAIVFVAEWWTSNSGGFNFLFMVPVCAG